MKPNNFRNKIAVGHQHRTITISHDGGSDLISSEIANQPKLVPPGDPREGKLLRVSEAARMLKAHPNSVRHWADIGLLPSYRFGLRGDRRFKA